MPIDINPTGETGGLGCFLAIWAISALASIGGLILIVVLCGLALKWVGVLPL